MPLIRLLLPNNCHSTLTNKGRSLEKSTGGICPVSVLLLCLGQTAEGGEILEMATSEVE